LPGDEHLPEDRALQGRGVLKVERPSIEFFRRIEVSYRMAVVALVAVLLGPASYAGQGNPQGKGQGQPQGQVQESSHGQGQDKSKEHGKSQDDGAGHSQGDGHSQANDHDHGQGQAGKDNHGQVVSDCNHRANDRKLKGQERQDFVEWCTDTSERHGYNDGRWTGDRSCYEKADKKGLRDSARRDFVRRCLDANAADYNRKSSSGDKDGNKGKQKD
jgi:hypothetical protein